MPSGKGLGQYNSEHTFEFLITPHWSFAQIGMVMGQGGVGLNDGIFAPTHAPPLMTGKIFLPYPSPLGPWEALPYLVKLYFLLICPTTICI